MRRTALVVMISGAVALAGCQGPQAADGGPEVTTVGPSPSVVHVSPVSPSGRATAMAIPAKIPDDAMLTAADTNDGGQGGRTGTRKPPEICAGRAYPSTAKIAIAATSGLYYRSPGSEQGTVPADQLYDTVAVYQPGGASALIADLTKAVADCPKGKAGDLPATWTVRGSLGQGDESVLIERSVPKYTEAGDLEPGKSMLTWIAVVRSGDAVTLVENSGYEGVAIDRPTFEKLVTKATGRLTAWLR